MPIGNTSGQLALAPSNQFHQIMASAGYAISPTMRASAEIAVGRMTQDAAYLALTTNTSLVVPALPAQSLQGRADTLNASLRLTAAPIDRLRLNASYTRDERDNQTPTASYPSVATDMFVGLPRSNQTLQLHAGQDQAERRLSRPGQPEDQRRRRLRHPRSAPCRKPRRRAKRRSGGASASDRSTTCHWH